MSKKTDAPSADVQVVVSGVPAALLADIDMLAKMDQRKRAAWIRKTLAEIVEEKKKQRQLAA